MEIFEEWVEKLRNNLRQGLESGRLPLGEDFEMPENFGYYTTFEMGPTKEQKSKLHGCLGNQWEVPICL